MRGRKPLTRMEQAIDGNGQPPKSMHKARVHLGGDAGPELDTPPRDLPAEGRRHWAEVVPALRAIGAFDTTDRAGLRDYCLLHVRAPRRA